jgi:phage terminase large subunit-like protein
MSRHKGEQLKALYALLDKRKEERKGEFFDPNGKQEEFIRLVGEGKKFISLFVGGNGVGKTALLANILGNIIWGPQNQYFQGMPIYDKFPHPKRIRIGTESKNIELIGSIDTEIQKWWPRGKYEGIKAGKMWISQYKTDNGFLIDKMSYQQETKEWESATLGVACFDEPPPKEIFHATLSRMREGGIILFYMTPLMDSAWIQDELVEAPNKDYGITFADIEDNCLEHGVRGRLDHNQIQLLISSMDDDEVQARARGRFMHLSSVILAGSFDKAVHVVGNDYQPPPDAQWGMVIDPAPGKAWAMCWYWVDTKGQIVIDTEYPETDFSKSRETVYTTRDYIEIMRNVEYGRHMEWRIVDRHGASQRSYGGKTLKMELNDDLGFDFQDSYTLGDREIETGIDKVKAYLRYDKKQPLGPSNSPKLLVKERCRNIIRSLQRWRRDEKMQPERLSPYKDHFDLVRYICMSEPEVYQHRPLPPRRHSYVVGRV